MVQNPFLTIITPCLNRVEFVSQAVESALLGGFPDLEHIIIDGGSTDGTLDKLSSFRHLKVISEPDRGIYDALNKGLRLAQGEVIGFLNTDDLYEPGILRKVVEVLNCQSDCLALLAGASIFTSEGVDHYQIAVNYHPYGEAEFLQQVTWGVPLFNAWFFRRQVFERYGSFELRYRYAADRDFLIRLALDAVPYTLLDETAYHYRQHPGSLTFNPQINAESGMVQEFRDIAEHYLRLNITTPAAERCFRRWHSLVTSHQTLLAVRSFKAVKSVRCARRGLLYDPGWLRVFAGELAASGERRFKPLRSDQAVQNTAAGV